jgi:hypothetical protein
MISVFTLGKNQSGDLVTIQKKPLSVGDEVVEDGANKR